MKNPRVSRREKNLKIRAEINAKETKETIAKINKDKSWFFEKVNKIDKLLARLIKKQREKNHINKIRNENGEITTGRIFYNLQKCLEQCLVLIGKNLIITEVDSCCLAVSGC